MHSLVLAAALLCWHQYCTARTCSIIPEKAKKRKKEGKEGKVEENKTVKTLTIPQDKITVDLDNTTQQNAIQ